MRLLISIISSFIILGCSIVETGCPCPEEYNFSAGELEILKSRAEDGDPEAAMQLSRHFDMCIRDFEDGEFWLRKAAFLKQPEAQRWLGQLIKTYNKPYTEFGATQEKALFSLFSDSCNAGNSDACYELALIYETGSTQVQSHEKARQTMRKCANLGERSCWDKLSEYYFYGIGGPANYNEAYFWISLEAMCVHPESIKGKEVWIFRNLIAEKISKLEDFIKIWALLDRYIENIENKKFYIYSDRCGGTTVKTDVYEDCIKTINERENIHRKNMHNKFNSADIKNRAAD